jgi:hypothetical protein
LINAFCAVYLCQSLSLDLTSATCPLHVVNHAMSSNTAVLGISYLIWSERTEVPTTVLGVFSRTLRQPIPTHYPFSATYWIVLNSSISDSQSNTRTQCARLAYAVITRQARMQEDDWLARVNWWILMKLSAMQ